jgi:uroporphyrin-III C-methyltransferase
MEIDLSPLDLPEFAAGAVWLVGAGPGAPGLLSLAALLGAQTGGRHRL